MDPKQIIEMTKFKRMLLAAVAVVLTVSAAGREATRLPNLFNQVDQVAMNAWVDSVFDSMSPEARIGQLIIAAVTPSDNNATRELVRRLVTQNMVGGLIYENSTIADQAAVTNLAQSLAAVPLMITIDGEWGLGMRLKEVPISSATSSWGLWTTICCSMSTVAKWPVSAAAWAFR